MDQQLHDAIGSLLQSKLDEMRADMQSALLVQLQSRVTDLLEHIVTPAKPVSINHMNWVSFHCIAVQPTDTSFGGSLAATD